MVHMDRLQKQLNVLYESGRKDQAVISLVKIVRKHTDDVINTREFCEIAIGPVGKYLRTKEGDAAIRSVFK